MVSKEEIIRASRGIVEQEIIDALYAHRKRSASGIYYLIDNDEIVYIGQSIRVYGRVLTHIKERSKQFNRFAWISIKAEQLNVSEAAQIVAHNPKYNRWALLPSNDLYMTMTQIKSKYGAERKEIMKTVRENNIRSIAINGVVYYEARWIAVEDDSA